MDSIRLPGDFPGVHFVHGDLPCKASLRMNEIGISGERIYALPPDSEGALGSVTDSHGQALLADAEIERIAAQDMPQVSTNLLTQLFHPGQSAYTLPLFTRRLRTFKAERGL